MIYSAMGTLRREADEPAMRSCWECNPAHERLKKVNSLHACFICDRYWIFERFLDSFASDQEMDEWIKGKGLQIGQSTTTIDAGYRVTIMEIRPKE